MHVCSKASHAVVSGATAHQMPFQSRRSQIQTRERTCAPAGAPFPAAPSPALPSELARTAPLGAGFHRDTSC